MKEKIRGRAERSLGGGSGDGRLEKLPPGGSGSQPVPVKYSWLIGKLPDHCAAEAAETFKSERSHRLLCPQMVSLEPGATLAEEILRLSRPGWAWGGAAVLRCCTPNERRFAAATTR